MAWEQLISIRDEAIAYARDERTMPPVACPNDGEPLRAGSNGSLRCTFDGYEWPRDR